MAGVVVERLPHECGARRSLNVFQNDDGTYSGWCFSCKTYVPNVYEDKPEGYKPPVGFKKSPEEIEAELKAIQKFKSFAMPDRKLLKDSVEHYEVRVSVSEVDGETPTAHYYPYYKNGELSGYKVRVVDGKKFWSVGDCNNVDLFGWNKAIQSGSKKLFITEGEADAIALYQILSSLQKEEYRDNLPAVVSLPHGSAAASKDLARCVKDIRAYFKEVVFVFDMDEPGKQAVEDGMKILPEAIVASLPAKDANACLMEGRSKACFNAVMFNAKKPKNTRIVSSYEVADLAKKPVEWGYSWPYKKLTDLTRGIRLGETYYLGAGVKMGKSELLNDIVAWCIKEHDWKVFVAKPEEANHRTLQGVVGKIVNRIFHDPKIPFDNEKFNEGLEIVRDKLFMLNLYQELTLEGLKEDVRAAAAEGCKAIFIDPITVLSNGINAADANTLLQKLAQELAAMAMDLEIVIFMFAHLKAPDAGPPHERGGAVQSYQFAGSRAMMRAAHLMIGLEGNKDPDLPEDQRNMRSIVVLENRMSGETGRIGLFYDKNTGAFNEI
jgi:twinkle protein